jgi:hypothetical protein
MPTLAARIHEFRGQMENGDTSGSWRTFQYAKRNGNLYPGRRCCHISPRRGNPDRFSGGQGLPTSFNARKMPKTQLMDNSTHFFIHHGRECLIKWCSRHRVRFHSPEAYSHH